MSNGSEIGGLFGAVVGFVGSGFNPAGAQWGFMIGSAIGSYIAPTKINGPKLGDGQRQTSTDGQPIAWILGTAPIVGTIVQASQYRDIKVKDSGKGAPKVTHQERLQDFAILICESCSLRDSMMASCIMVTQDGKIVYDVRPGSTMLDASAKWKQNITFQFGAEDQLPNATMEMDTGVGNTASYRGVATMIADGFNITNAGGRIPTFQFVMASNIYPRPYESGRDIGGLSTLGGGGAHDGISTIAANIVIPTGGLGWPIYILGVNKSLPPARYSCVRTILYDGVGGRALWDSGWFGNAEALGLMSDYFSDGPIDGLDDTILNNNQYVAYIGDRTTETLVATNYIFSAPGHLIGAGTVGAEFYAAFDEVQGETIPLPLSNFITRICKRGGLTDAQVDANSLSTILVEGYPIARPCTGVQALIPLMQTYFAYGSEYDGQIHFMPRGADAVMTIAEEDLVVTATANDGAVTSSLRNMETQFPRKMIGSYIDPAQNYTTVTVSDERLAIDVNAIGTQNFDMPVVMPANDALAATVKAMKVQYATLEGTLSYTVPFATKNNVYLRLVAGDAVIFRGKRWEITSIKLSGDGMTLNTVYSRQSAFTADVEAITGKEPTVPASPYGAPVTLVPFNSPSLRPQDTTGIYLGASSSTGADGWRGCIVQVSYDDQASWTTGPTIGIESVMGKVTAADPLTVQMNDELLSVTDAQLSANANVFALIHATGTELGQFKTATEVDDTPNAYVLTGLVRGGLGTEQSAATVNENMVMADNVYFLPIDPSFDGRTIYLRAIAPGETAEDATVVSIVYNPIGQPELTIREDVDGNIRVDAYGNQRVTN